MQDANSVYDQAKPWQSMQEGQVSERLAGMSRMSTAQIEAIRPPIANIGKHPNRFGYGDCKQPTIEDVIGADRVWPIPRVDWSGTQAGIQSTTYPALGVV
jgi:hypothetical protein